MRASDGGLPLRGVLSRPAEGRRPSANGVQGPFDQPTTKERWQSAAATSLLTSPRSSLAPQLSARTGMSSGAGGPPRSIFGGMRQVSPSVRQRPLSAGPAILQGRSCAPGGACGSASSDPVEALRGAAATLELREPREATAELARTTLQYYERQRADSLGGARHESAARAPSPAVAPPLAQPRAEGRPPAPPLSASAGAGMPPRAPSPRRPLAPSPPPPPPPAPPAAAAPPARASVPSARAGPPPGMSEPITIHVCDEQRGLERDFHCELPLLLRHMRYFQTYLSAVSHASELDISVHCDVEVFGWLVAYVRAQPPPAERGGGGGGGRGPGAKAPQLEVANCVSILISSAFLQMDELVGECERFVAAHVSCIVLLPIDLSCISDEMVERISAQLGERALAELHDPRAKLAPRIFECALRGLAASARAAALAQCRHCARVFTPAQREWEVCARAQPSVDRHGCLSARHEPQLAWQLRGWLAVLRAAPQSLDAPAAYWRLWAQLHALSCADCGRSFVAAELGCCRYHPRAPAASAPGGVASYGCCAEPARQVDLFGDAISSGCCFRDHRQHAQPSGAGDEEAKTWQILRAVRALAAPSGEASARIESSALRQQRVALRLELALQTGGAPAARAPAAPPRVVRLASAERVRPAIAKPAGASSASALGPPQRVALTPAGARRRASRRVAQQRLASEPAEQTSSGSGDDSDSSDSSSSDDSDAPPSAGRQRGAASARARGGGAAAAAGPKRRRPRGLSVVVMTPARAREFKLDSQRLDDVRRIDRLVRALDGERAAPPPGECAPQTDGGERSAKSVRGAVPGLNWVRDDAYLLAPKPTFLRPSVIMHVSRGNTLGTSGGVVLPRPGSLNQRGS